MGEGKSKIIDVALKRFKQMQEHNQEVYKVALEDMHFIKGDQWPDDVKMARQQDNRPCLTINKMPQHVRQVENDQKQNRPAIQVSPVDDYADIDTAHVLQGMIRNIENVSDAEYAYDKGFEGACRGGIGYFRLSTDYVDEKSFDLEARVDVIDNPFKAGIDPYSILPDGSDAKWGFVWDSMSREDFEAEFGKSKLARHEDWDGLTKNYDGWIGDDEVRIAEYFFKDIKRVKLIELSDGEVYFEDELPQPNEDGTFTLELEEAEDIGGVLISQEVFEVVRERWTTKCEVKHLKINAIEVLEETTFPGSYIPIIPVYGYSHNIDGEIIRESVIRHAKDSQRILNFWASSEAEAITLAPKAPFIGAEGQFTGHENKWGQANVKNYPYLEYNPVSHEGHLAPPPQRNAFEPPVMAITQARLQANQDVKEGTGIYDASLGNRSNEVTGIAIQRRNQQSQTSNFHYVDNLAKSIRHAGRILVQIIPIIYDADRIVRTLGFDGEEKLVRINSDQNLLEDQKRAYHFSFGKYDVTISTGPNYETKRQEARDSMIQMSQASPKFAEVAGDLMVQNMDWPGSQEIAKRLKKTLPPEIVSDDEQEIPPQAQAVIGELTQRLELLAQENQILRNTQEKDLLKIQSDEKRALMKIEADYRMKLLDIEGQEHMAMVQQELAQINRRIEILGQNYNQSIEMQQNAV